MGCAITGEKKVIPSIVSAKKKKNEATSSVSNPNHLTDPDHAFPVLSRKPIPQPNDYTDPIVTHIEPRPDKRDRGPSSQLHLSVKVPDETSPKSKHISPMTADVSSYKGDPKNFFLNPDGKGSAPMLEDTSFKKPAVSTFQSIARIASLTSVDLGDNSHAPKAHPVPLSMNYCGMPSNLLSQDKGESLRSVPVLCVGEDRQSLDDLASTGIKKDKYVSSLGLIEAVEEVSLSREINIRNDEQAGLKPVQDQNLEGKILRARSQGDNLTEASRNLCVLIPPENIIKNTSRHLMHKDTPTDGKVNIISVEVQNKNTLDPQGELSGWLKSPLQDGKIKAQMKAKFTRNLVELVTHKSDCSPLDKENCEPNKQVPANVENFADKENSLSLIYCPPDEMESQSQRPNLDIKILDIFKNTEDLSPIRRQPNRAFYEDATPLTSRENSVLRKKVENSTLLEEKTITNIEDNLSESDIDKYSFVVAEVREVEIDERNDYNVFKGGNTNILPHPLVQKSACNDRYMVYVRSSTLDPKTLCHPSKEVEKPKIAKPGKAGTGKHQQQVVDSARELGSDKM